MWKKTKEVWSAVRQLLSFRSFLDALGVKGLLMAALSTAAFIVWSYLQRLPTPALAVLAFLCFVLVLFAVFMVRVWRMIPAPLAGSRENEAQARQTVGQSKPGDADSPEIVIDYVYAEDSKDHHDANAPLVVRNISTTASAYNVEILPLKTATMLGRLSSAWFPNGARLS